MSGTVFIAYASPDLETAQRLGWELEDEDVDIFIDKNIQAGDIWPKELVEALNAARIIVVLVSDKTDQAHYEHDEIARAIKRARDPEVSCIVIPVLIQGCDEEYLPYGLQPINVIDGRLAGGMRRVALEIRDRLKALGGDPAEEEVELGYRLIGPAINLDRVKQWDAFKQADREASDRIWLLHGPIDQSVELFLQRVQIHLGAEMQVARSVYRIMREVDGMSAQIGKDWLRHLRHAVDPGGNDVVAKLRSQPSLIIVGDTPLSDFDADECKGLEDFLTHILPSYLEQNDITRGVSILVPVEYFDHDRGFLNQLKSWLKITARETGITFAELPEISLPSWEEIEDFLCAQDPPPKEATQMRIKAMYDRMKEHAPPSFRVLAAIIDRHTQEKNP